MRRSGGAYLEFPEFQTECLRGRRPKRRGWPGSKRRRSTTRSALEAGAVEDVMTLAIATSWLCARGLIVIELVRDANHKLMQHFQCERSLIAEIEEPTLE